MSHRARTIGDKWPHQMWALLLVSVLITTKDCIVDPIGLIIRSSKYDFQEKYAVFV